MSHFIGIGIINGTVLLTYYWLTDYGNVNTLTWQRIRSVKETVIVKQSRFVI